MQKNRQHVEVKAKVDPCKDIAKDVSQLKQEIADLTKRLQLWRELGRHHGPVSPHELINQALIKLKAAGEI